MIGQAIVIRADASAPQKLSFDRMDERSFAAWLNQCVGGYFETVGGVERALGLRAVAFANEDGMRLELPPNVLATSMLHQHQMLLGTIVIVYGDDEFMDAL